MSSYYLIGPIDFPGPIFLTVAKDNVSYFLTLTDDNDLVFDPRITKPLEMMIDTNGSSSVEFTFSDSDDSVKYIGVGFGLIAAPSATQTSLVPLTTEINPWGGNVAFLTGVHYAFHDSGNMTVNWNGYVPDVITNGVVESIKMEDGAPVLQTFTSTIRALPSEWYESGSCSATSDTEAVIDAERLWVTQTGQVPQGFVLLSDCQTGIRYSYCGPKVDCSGRCKGPCANKDETCEFDNNSSGSGGLSDGAFKCVKGEPPTRPIWERPWVWAVAIVTIIIVLIIVFVLISRLDAKD